MIGDSAYASVPEAVKAIVDKKEPQGSTIKLTKDLTGPGVQVAGGQKFTFDLGGHTYTVTDPTVGSTGTETNAFQLMMGSNLTFRHGVITTESASGKILIQNYSNLKLDTVGSTGTETNAFQLMMGSNLTFRHGVITTESASGKILIQNYSNLKLEGVTLKGGPHTAYTLSNNNGNVTIESVVVTVEKGAGEIVGVIETSVSGGATGKGPIGLNIIGGNLSKATLVCDGESAETIKVVKDPSVALAAPDGHEWVGGTLVKPSEKAVAAVVKPSGDVVTFAQLAAALAAADGATVQLLTDVTESVVIPAGKVATLDLAGHRITNVAGEHTITNKGGLTVVDSASGGVVDNVSHGRAALVTEEGSVTVLSGGTFKRSAEVGTLGCGFCQRWCGR